MGFSFDFARREVCWALIWSAQIAPKVRNFLWCLLHGIVPVFVNLFRRGTAVDNVCTICYLVGETIEHVIFECHFSNRFWLEFGLFDLSLLPQGQSGVQFWSSLMVLWSASNMLEKTAYLCWMIWFNRNRCFHDNICMFRPSIVCKKASEFCEEYASVPPIPKLVISQPPLALYQELGPLLLWVC